MAGADQVDNEIEGREGPQPSSGAGSQASSAAGPQPSSGAGPQPSFGVPQLKRPIDLEDAGERAQKRRRPGNLRIGLEKIGFWPGNRGGMGISPYHVHEVA